VPPPFIWDGYWGNYADLEKTFEEDWERFNKRERNFFSRLWKLRLFSVLKTWIWFFKQQCRLIGNCLTGKLKPWLLLVYVPLLVVGQVVLALSVARFPRLITGFLRDVRLYVDPEGIVERAIVQRIDRRVGEQLMRMLGLDMDFRPLPEEELIPIGDRLHKFDRVVWVAHSLGTVISYNVLSDLFKRATAIEGGADSVQKDGVKDFRKKLKRFITLGSPLDKIVFLYVKALRPWPVNWKKILQSSSDVSQDSEPGVTEDSAGADWWVNFYHLLDPVSGPLDSEKLHRGESIDNHDVGRWRLPMLAHVSYWKDSKLMTLIHRAAYDEPLTDKEQYHERSAAERNLRGVLAYFLWIFILMGILDAVIWLTEWCFGPESLRMIDAFPGPILEGVWNLLVWALGLISSP
jgi:hypothetical protein